VLAVFLGLGAGGADAPPVSMPVVHSAAPPSARPTAPAHVTLADAPAPKPAPGRPVTLRIPRIGVVTSLQSLGLLPDGALQPPSNWDEAGWFAAGVRPGAIGPAVIAGHVDSYLGPAVFFRLRELKPGDDVQVEDATGVIRHFTVTDVAEYPKTSFPTAAVYGATSLPVLRLITCTGTFNPSARSYLDNLVVSTDLRE
jgi:hypothetical protein